MLILRAEISVFQTAQSGVQVQLYPIRNSLMLLQQAHGELDFNDES